jgi:hypothetical protein
MNYSRLGALLAGSLSLTACGAADLVRPYHSPAAIVTLTASSSVSLASVGDTDIVTPLVFDQQGNTIDGVRLHWSFSPSGIVQQDGDGIFRAIGNGRVTVVVEIDPGETGVRPAGYWAARIADSVVIEVRQRPARVTFAPVDTAFTALGGTRQVRVQVADARGHPMLDGPPLLTWQSSDPRVVLVDSVGVVRSFGEGTARISVHAGELTGGATFTVRPRLPHTSCMVVEVRRQNRQSCVTIDLIVREREGGQ